MSESEHNNSGYRQENRERNQQDPVVFWQAAESQTSYMREVGQFNLLSASEELAWARQVDDSRKKIRRIISDFPQILLQELRELGDSSETGRLPGGLVAADGDELTVQSVRQQLEELINWAAEHQENFQKWRSKSPAMDIFRNEFTRRLNSLGLRDRFFEDCVQALLQQEKAVNEPPDTETKQQLQTLAEASEQARQAKNILVEANLRLVISIAKHYAGGLVPLPDLVQEGNLGLMRAVETFNYQLGHRLTTYSTYWIRQAIGRAVALQGRSIRMPVNTLRHLSKIRQCERELLQQTGRIPEAHEIAKKLDMSAARVSALIKMSQQPISLHSIRNGDQEWGETISDENSPHPGEQVAFDSLKDTVRDALGTLEAKEKEVIVRRFGLDDHACETLEQIGRRLNLTSERIRQIETTALRKLRDPVKNKYFAGFE
ncbi:MAG: sigma-70 family RNA polymerase sigma factor [Lentisphaeria bacterium]|jgi:RNA polymerase primary sigma factor|nr:sigma-70 family RNA polymerase sigma factor [Lentisphaeria bacterium]